MLKKSSKLLLALQHLLAMFGATVLVPFLTGMNGSIALLCAGLGTLVFHLVTKGQVPVFLGSSFAFIGVIAHTMEHFTLAEVKAGAIAASVVYLLLSITVKRCGLSRVEKLFPPVVVGPIIISIGLRLTPTALSMAGLNQGRWDGHSAIITLTVITIVIFLSVMGRSFFRMMPILLAIIGGYGLSAALGMVDTSAIQAASWLGFDYSAREALMVIPRFNLGVSLSFMMVSLVVFMEHIGDMSTSSAIVGKNFLVSPGLHRTLLGDGLATALAGLLGGPPNTTYGENTGVLAITKVYDSSILRLAAVYAVVLAFIGKFGAFLQSIPQAVMGAISIVLFGMIAVSGIRVLLQSNLDFSHSRNLMLIAVILSLAIGVGELSIGQNFSLSGLTLAAIIGVVLNALLPQEL